MMDTDIVLQVMTTDEALAWKSRVGDTSNHLRILLFEGYEREAWRALEYADWTSCVKALAKEYDLTERRLWQLHSANQTEKLLNHGSVGEIPERVLRPLTSLPIEEQSAVYQQAIGTAPEGKATVAHVEQAAKAYRQERTQSVPAAPPPPDPKEVVQPPTADTRHQASKESHERRAILYRLCSALLNAMLDAETKAMFNEIHEELYDTATEYWNEMQAIEQ
jgi:hypothetical protein